MARSNLLKNLATNLNNALLERANKVEDFLPALQKEIFSNIESNILINIGTAPKGANKLLIEILNIYISEYYDNSGDSKICAKCKLSFAGKNVNPAESSVDFSLFTRKALIFSEHGSFRHLNSEQIKFFRFYLNDFHTDIPPEELFPDGFQWEIPLT